MARTQETECDCGRARRVLGTLHGPGGGPDELAAQRHLAGCADCRRFFAELEATAGWLRRSAPRPAMPAARREAVFEELAEVRTRCHHRQRRRGLGVVVLATLGLTLGLLALRIDAPGNSSATGLLSALTEDHARSLHGAEISSRDPATLRRWAGQQVAFSPAIPRIADQLPEGARLCLMPDRRGLVLRYRIDGRSLSYYIMPALTSDADAASLLQSHARDGYRIVAWKQAGLVHALVADLPEADLDSLARACASALAGGRADHPACSLTRPHGG